MSTSGPRSIPNHKLKWDAGNPTEHSIVFLSRGGHVFCFVQNEVCEHDHPRNRGRDLPTMVWYSAVADAYDAERWKTDPDYRRYGAPMRDVLTWWWRR
jgi:hypothetical protein